MKKGLILAVLLAIVPALGFSQANTWTVNNVGAWIDAVYGIRSGGNDKEYAITVTGNAYTFKHTDAANTLTLTIRMDGSNLVISGDSGSGENNWNGEWRKQ